MAITTNKEYLTAVLSRFGASENDIDVILIDNSLTGTATVDAPACKKAMYNSMTSILRAGSVSEGGYSMSWDIEAVKMWYDSLCKELGYVNVLKAQIKDKSHLW